MPTKQDCPFWRGACKEHKCRLYIQIIGPNPNTGESMNMWGCSFEFLPWLLIENSKEQRQTCASVDKVATETARNNMAASDAFINATRQMAGATMEVLGHAMDRINPPDQKLINGR